MLQPKIIMECQCCERMFSIVRYRIKTGHIYMIEESGVVHTIQHRSIEAAYQLLAQRLHVHYCLSTAEAILLTKEQICEN